MDDEESILDSFGFPDTVALNIRLRALEVAVRNAINNCPECGGKGYYPKGYGEIDTCDYCLEMRRVLGDE